MAGVGFHSSAERPQGFVVPLVGSLTSRRRPHAQACPILPRRNPPPEIVSGAARGLPAAYYWRLRRLMNQGRATGARSSGHSRLPHRSLTMQTPISGGSKVNISAPGKSGWVATIVCQEPLTAADGVPFSAKVDCDTSSRTGMMGPATDVWLRQPRNDALQGHRFDLLQPSGRTGQTCSGAAWPTTVANPYAGG